MRLQREARDTSFFGRIGQRNLQVVARNFNAIGAVAAGATAAGVGAIVAPDQIIAIPPKQAIVPFFTMKLISAGKAEKGVGALVGVAVGGIAPQGVRSTSAIEIIVAGAAEDFVFAGLAEDVIVAIAPLKPIVASPSEEGVIEIAADNHVITLAAEDERRNVAPAERAEGLRINPLSVVAKRRQLKAQDGNEV